MLCQSIYLKYKQKIETKFDKIHFKSIFKNSKRYDFLSRLLFKDDSSKKYRLAKLKYKVEIVKFLSRL